LMASGQPVSRDRLRDKLSESVTAAIPPRIARDVRIPAIPGKALAVIGVRRGGKTSFLQRRMAEHLAAGRPRESQLLLELEDERLAGLTATDLGWIVEEHGRRFPHLRPSGALSVYLDEVQVVPGWETLVHRLLAAGDIEIAVSGSSSKLLSREVATSLRGRAMEVLVHPFSFRETLRLAGTEPDMPWEKLDTAARAELDLALQQYLTVGGFPEAQGADGLDRSELLTGYVDTMVLRDVIERHNVSNVRALRWLQRHLLATPGGSVSVKKLYDDLKSQGISVGKDTVYDYVSHFEDAFLLRSITMHSNSERQRMSNPRKVYPVDTGLIAIYERAGRTHRGRALETAVLLELERRRYAVDWLRTAEGWEVDFFATRADIAPLLVQVCLDTTADETWEREVRALASAAAAFPDAQPLLITLDPTPPARELPLGLQWWPAAGWLLDS
jgi:predicted AAA+ superfamily ATPase